MLRYRSDIWEYTTRKGIGIPSIKQVVIFFYPKDDNRLHELNDVREDNSNISYSYDVVRIWEMKKNYVIDNKLQGLYSLLPLMEVESYETDEEIIENTVKIIETIEDEALRQDSLAAMAVIASDKYSSALIRKYIRSEMLMNPPIYKEWMEEERKEAAEEAAKEATLKVTRSNIIDLLAEEFDFIPRDIRMDIEDVEDIDILKSLLKSTIKVESIEEFRSLLEKAKKVM